MSLEIPPEKATTVSNLKSGIASNRPGWVFWILILLAFLGFGQHCLGSFDGRGSVKKSEAASCAVSVGLLASRILSCWILYGEVSLFFSQLPFVRQKRSWSCSPGAPEIVDCS